MLARIAALSIPPAWREVWICADERGHLQATGFDAAGRKQYIYHERWRSHRDRLKFESMLGFGHALPRLRRRVHDDLAGAGLTRPRVLACAVRLLDLGFFRVGSEDYAERNDSYGLSTLHTRHLSIRCGHAIFDYRAKSGRRRMQLISDSDTLPVLRALKRRRGGGHLLAFSAHGRYRPLHADEINAYIKDAAAGNFSAKDFRTWNATVLAAIALAARVQAGVTSSARRRAVNESIKAVAAYLGNTPAVCRASYVDPRLIDRFQAGHTIAPLLERLPDGPEMADQRARRRIEVGVIDLLNGAKPDRHPVTMLT